MKGMKNKFPIPKSIFWGVIGAHALLCYFYFIKEPPKRFKVRKTSPIQTHMVMIAPPKKASPRVHVTSNSKPTKKKVLPLPKERKPNPPKKTHLVKVEPKIKPEIKLPKREEISSVVKKKDEIKLPSNLGALAIESKKDATPLKKQLQSQSLKVMGTEYQNQLKDYLYTHLKLPRMGRIKIEVTLNRDGKIKEIQVKEATDQQMLYTIKERVANMNLPPFSHELIGKTEQKYIFEFY